MSFWMAAALVMQCSIALRTMTSTFRDVSHSSHLVDENSIRMQVGDVSIYAAAVVGITDRMVSEACPVGLRLVGGRIVKQGRELVGGRPRKFIEVHRDRG